MNELDIQLIPTDKLIEELRNRFDAFAIMGIQKKPKGNEEDRYYWDYSGGLATCIGLAELLKTKIKKHYFESGRDGEDF